MATRLRLQRHGKKGKPFYHVVAADARAPRDGRFIEKVGTYNPNTNPATIEVKHDRALYWLQVGAEMSDTVRALMKYKGVVYHNHLLNGVKKGAFTEEEAQKRFEKWMADKNAKVQSKIDALTSASDKEKAARLKAEQEVNAAREAAQQAAENAAAEAEAAAAAEAAGEAAAVDRVLPTPVVVDAARDVVHAVPPKGPLRDPAERAGPARVHNDVVRCGGIRAALRVLGVAGRPLQRARVAFADDGRGSRHRKVPLANRLLSTPPNAPRLFPPCLVCV